MLSKILLYLEACNKGEVFKRIEYKLKDLFGYFYIRNRLMKVDDIYIIKMPKIKKIKFNGNYEELYYIFNKKNDYLAIKGKLYANDKFWRKNNILEYDDIKSIWEYNRLQFLPSIALKYKVTKKSKYKKIIVDTLDYWFEVNKYEYSINWTNNLEVAIRSISLFITLLILNDKKLNAKYSKLLYLHGNYIYSEINYSKACIPNNHLIGEAVALLVLSKILKHKNSKKWESRAIKILKLFNGIIADDGTSCENSFSYQFFVTKMFILALCFIDDKELHDIINKKVIASLKFLKLTVYSNGVINYGDNDDGYFYSFSYKYSLKNDIIRYYNLFFDIKLDDEATIIKELLSVNKNSIQFGIQDGQDYFANKNLFVYKWDNNLIFFNAKNVKWHAHDDSLHIELIINGKNVLPDLGTYSYNLDRKKRKKYISRKSHNTILSDKNNAVHIGTFRWKNLYESYLENVNIKEDSVSVTGIIENVCKRRIEIDKLNENIKIFDETLDSHYLISNNWNVPNSKIDENVINNKYCDIIINTTIDKIINNNISKKYLDEKRIKSYQTSKKKQIITNIVIK